MEHPIDFLPALDRRRALAWMAASLALGGGGCVEAPRGRIYPWVQMPEARAAGLPLFYASACVRDGHALGVLVGTAGGRPIKIEGNPAHPSSLGATDVFAQACVLQLWDPDRSATVQQRLHAGATAADAAAAGPSTWAAFDAAWAGEAARLQARAGEGFALLTGPLTSPSLRAQILGLLRRWPRARWYQHTALPQETALAGAVAAFGRALQPLYRLDAARCIVALGADPFSDGPGAVRQAMDWSSRRDAQLFAAEATPGLFGARAERRIALAPQRIDALVARLAGALAGGPGAGDAFEAALLRALQAAGPQALLVPGACLSSTSHALVHAMHAQLQAAGRTVQMLEALAFAPEAGSLAELTAAMGAGAVEALVVLDANPVYEAPGPFARALPQVAFSLHAGLYRDETARACQWQLPLSHDCERWGDALAHDGSLTLVQPAIAPLYDSRSANELLALLARDELRDGYALLQRHWRSQWGADFDTRWRDSLQRGVVAGSAPAPVAAASQPIAAFAAGATASIGAANAAAAPSEATATVPADGSSAPSKAPLAARAEALPSGTPLTALFAADPSTHDGRYANNGWLQELPRPFTKLTWDNALLLSPRDAAALGLATGDVVRASVGAAQVEAPVWILGGQAEGVVTVPLGYGRRAAGRVGDGVGFDGYALQPSGAATAAIRLERLGRRHDFAVTQHTISQHGRDLARTVRPGESLHEPARPSLYPQPPRPHDGGPAWAMSIDLDACIGCNACTIACQAENNIPVVGKQQVALGREMHWIRVDRYEAPELAGSIFQPVPCMHCEKAPCELVCPVGATVHDTEGLNVQVYNRCIGTRFCSQNCPYKVRRFNFLQFGDEATESLKGQRNPEVTVRQRGVMEKCTYCLQRIARARQHAQAEGRPLAEGEVVTACQAVCPTRAIRFGDLRQAGSAVAADRQSPRHYALLGELNTQPRTTYLARVRRGEDSA